MGRSDIMEGMIRQSTDNPYPELRLLGNRGTVLGREVIRRGDSIYVKTNFEDIPIYAFKMNNDLQKFLQQHRSVWDGE
tara:strand:+ start:484 stop:717 length:234 start_codon:yes stop_codon:yes gene_type:complete